MKKLALSLLLLLGCIHSQTTAKSNGNTLATGTTAMDANPALTPVSMAITPTNCPAVVDTDCGYTATLTLSNGTKFDVTHYASWTTSAPAIADVCPSPQCNNTLVQHYLCVSAGSSLISAQYGTFLQSTNQICTANVPPNPTVTAITVNPPTPSISVGATQPFTVTATMSDGTSQDVTSQVTWTVGTPSVAQLTGSVPPVLCVGAGSSLVTATLNLLTNSVTISCAATLTSLQVTPATASVLIGASPTFKATCTFSDGSSSDCTLLSVWTSTDNTIAKPVTPKANPEPYSALKQGTVTVTATIGALNGTASLVVTNPGPPPATLASIALTPANKTLNVNGTQDMVATCTYSDASTSNCTSQAIWSSANSAIVQLQLPDAIVGTPYSYTLTGTGATPYDWRLPSSTAPVGADDIIDWMAMPLPDRLNFHLTGGATPKYVKVDAGVLWLIKSAAGNPSDIRYYDKDFTYQVYTDNNDASQQAACIAAGYSSCFVDPFAYKQITTPRPFTPRYFVPGTTITILTPPVLQGGGQVNPYIKTTNCGADNQPIAFLGNVKTVTSGGLAMPAGIATWGGDVGVQPTVEVDYYYSGNVSGVYQNRERFYFVKGFGWVSWDHSTWNGSGWNAPDQGSTNNLKTAGGAPVPNFACKIPALPFTGELPPGVPAATSPQMNLASNTGIISGTPTTVGTYPFTLQQEDAGGAFHLQSQTIRVDTSAAQASQTVKCLIAGGPVAITAHIGAVTNNTNVTCQAPAPTIVSIAVTPTNKTGVNGSSLNYKATATMSDATTQDVTSSATWTVTSGVIAQVVGTANPQPVKCLTTGTTAVNAKVGAVTGSTNITCQPPAPPVAGNDTYEQPGDVCTFGSTDSFAQLPQTCVYSNPAAWVAGGTTRTATTAAQLTADLAAMACGDITVLNTGVSGQFVLPSLNCPQSNAYVIKGFGMASLPAYGTRVTPCFAGIASLSGYVHSDGSSVYNCGSASMNMPAITSTKSVGTGAVFRVPAGGTSGGVIEGLFLTRAPGGLVLDVAIDSSTGGQWSHMLIYKNIIAGTVGEESNRAMVLNRCDFCAAVDNFIYELHCIAVTGACTDAKGIGDGTNTHATDDDHAHKIVNNFIASAAQCLLSGGSAAAIVPNDLEIRNNYCFKPPSWNPICTVPNCGAAYNGGVGGHPYIVKNGMELKNANRVLYEGNYLENNWSGFSQVGNAFTLTPKNQNNLAPIASVTNITVRYNWVRSYAQIFQMANIASDAGGFGTAGNSWSLHDNLGENMQNANFCYQCQSSAAMMTLYNALNAPAGFALNHVDVNHNTDVIASNTIKAIYSTYIMGIDTGTSILNTNMKWQNNIFAVGYFGGVHSSVGGGNTLSCTNGKTDAVNLLNTCWPGSTITGNTILSRMLGNVNPSNPVWPAGTCILLGSEPGVITNLFVNYNNGRDGNYQVTPTSPCHSTGNDGKDPGADIPTLLNRVQATTVQ